MQKRQGRGDVASAGQANVVSAYQRLSMMHAS
jgi:hypothetical protein